MIMSRKHGNGGSIGIWGCIGELGVGCCMIYSGRMNKRRYLELLDDHLKPSLNLLQMTGQQVIYQQDGAPCPTAKTVQCVELLPWSANSPDLNPLENIWAEIDKKLAKTNNSSIFKYFS
jgi:hypothetical protein